MSKLSEVVAEMRALGVTEFHEGDMHIVLGPPPPPPAPPVKTLTPEEKKEAFRAVRSYREKMLFASSEGFEDEIDEAEIEPDAPAAPVTETTTQ